MHDNEWTFEDHALQPHHWQPLPNPDIDATVINPMCGDQLRLTLVVRGDAIQAVGWMGKGCMVSQAAASMLGDQLIGLTTEQALTISTQGLLNLLGVELSPLRQRCALLGLEALRQALQ